MTRRKAGKLQKLTPAERVSRRERNERRKRDSAAVLWAKQHVVKDKPRYPAPRPSKRKQAAKDLAAGLVEAVPAIEDAKAR